jgi:hypothetical protein
MKGGLLPLESEAEMPLARSRPSLPQLLLGALVVWQLVFLLADNAAPLLPGPAREVIGPAPLAWETLTGQGQKWNLFAPQVPAKALFLVVEAQAPDGLVTRLSSFFEPEDGEGYFHPPGSGDRLFHVEKELFWPLVVFDSKEVAARAEEWRAYLDDRIRARWRAYRGYLAWRRHQYLRQHPDVPAPQEWVLLVRVYPPSVAGARPARDEVVEVPFVRWRPDAAPPEGCLPLEVYDSGMWRWLPAGGAGG